MSDLQCPARLYVAWPRAGAAGEETLPERLVPGEHLAAVLTCPPGTSPDLTAVADLHRGEAVLVLVSGAPAFLPELQPGDVVPLTVDGDGWQRA